MTWTRIRPGYWRHVSGWEARHCGHPTANWPYYLLAPDGRMVVSEAGYGFKTIKLARQWLDERTYVVVGEVNNGSFP